MIDERQDDEFGIGLDPTHGAVALVPPVGRPSDPSNVAVACAGLTVIGLIALALVGMRRSRRSTRLTG
ncbi:MAG TPA: hypothetical protein VG346_07795 [Acidimicrobiales bacterium]|nr:hypothetical protein [Acidimicrobiales bacterium]